MREDYFHALSRSCYERVDALPRVAAGVNEGRRVKRAVLHAARTAHERLIALWKQSEIDKGTLNKRNIQGK